MVRLHSKHGVNPSITICPLCRGESGLILSGSAGAKLPGAASDGEAPRHVITPDLCTTCCTQGREHIALLVPPTTPTASDKKFSGEEAYKILADLPGGSTIIWLRRTVFQRIFNVPCPTSVFAFVDQETMNFLLSLQQSLTNQE